MASIGVKRAILEPHVYEAVWVDEDGVRHRAWLEERTREDAIDIANSLACGSQVFVSEAVHGRAA